MSGNGNMVPFMAPGFGKGKAGGAPKPPERQLVRPAKYQSIKEPVAAKPRNPSPSDPTGRTPFGEGTSGAAKVHVLPQNQRILPPSRASGQLRDLGFHAAGGYDVAHKALQAFHGGQGMTGLHSHGRQLQQYAKGLKKAGAHPEEMKKIRNHLGGLSQALHGGDQLAAHEHILGLQHGFYAAHHGFQAEHGPGGAFPMHQFAPPAGADQTLWNASQERLEHQQAEAALNPTLGMGSRRSGAPPPPTLDALGKPLAPGTRGAGVDAQGNPVPQGGGGVQEPQPKQGIIERIGGAVVDPVHKYGKKLGLFKDGEVFEDEDGGTWVRLNDDVPGEVIKLADDVNREHHAVLEKHGYAHEKSFSGFHVYVHKGGKHFAVHADGQTTVGPHRQPVTTKDHGELDSALGKIHGGAA